MDSKQISLPETEDGDRLEGKNTSVAGAVADWDKWEEKEDEIESEGHSLRYEKIQFLGEGQYATVWKAKDLENDNRIVAVKKISQGSREEMRDGINRTAIREIKFMRELKHENVLGLLDVFGGKYNMNLVFEFMETDLEHIIRESDIIITEANIKRYLIMILHGLEYLYARWLLHRDLKPNNLLIDPNGVLKLADFGLARFFGSPSKLLTSEVVTRWYRAPELLWGAQHYATGVDMWAVGCIVAELLLRVPLFPGDSDLEQLNKIFSLRGTPTDEEWPNHRKLRYFVQFKPQPSTPLGHVLHTASDELLSLTEVMLALNPLQRLSASKSLQMTFFSNYPPPTACSRLPKRPTVGQKRKKFQAEHGSIAKRLFSDDSG
ncbi:cyclin-dependent kinase 7-like [Convolutriloba macropyga]|uniref:cyclin-dependent kinase 7-like n=1 Tax=Convolutriloba macropyga TaxID=536237 RepID=UPI003F5251F4